ncbi:unnamed protein product [Ilex paraguariensis]|uniref:Uncharacterized protein n=1 Tax=Ilex paraguariensis TaxID=185542 RepID=A0ABC8RYY4_9AQUA
MGRLKAKRDYEDLRKTRILENQARFASLGLHKTISDLRSLTSSAKSEKTHVRKYCKVDYSCSILRRSNRLKRISADCSTSEPISLRRSNRLKRNYGSSTPSPKAKVGPFGDEGEQKRPTNAALVRIKDWSSWLSPEVLSRRCRSKSRGSVHDPVFGICCHFCRFSTLKTLVQQNLVDNKKFSDD